MDLRMARKYPTWGPTLKTTSLAFCPPAIEGDVGYNLPASKEVLIRAGKFACIPTGIHVEMPPETWGIVMARSSANISENLIVLTGAIDNGYRGELRVFVHNVSRPSFLLRIARFLKLDECWLEDMERREATHIRVGQSIAQLVLFHSVVPPVALVANLSPSSRGDRGFGSTGNGVNR